MLKKLIAPIQAYLLSKGQCVGCGMPLSRGVSAKHSTTTSKITCKCGRIFIYDTKNGSYRRALFSEV